MPTLICRECTETLRCIRLPAHDHRIIAQELIKAKAALNIENKDGDTPLHVSTNYGHTDITEALLAASANLELQNKDGDTPLHVAACRGRSDFVRMLINAGADTEIKNKNNDTPFNLADQQHHEGTKRIF